jgi:hypothetical protein
MHWRCVTADLRVRGWLVCLARYELDTAVDVRQVTFPKLARKQRVDLLMRDV